MVRTAVYENSVKAFHSSDEYVAILYKVATQGPGSTEISPIKSSTYHLINYLKLTHKLIKNEARKKRL
jgi:hypothetical protein